MLIRHQRLYGCFVGSFLVIVRGSGSRVYRVLRLGVLDLPEHNSKLLSDMLLHRERERKLYHKNL